MEEIGLLNKELLILERNEKLVVVDIKNKVIKKEIKFEHSIHSIIPLNEKIFLIETGSYIYQYYIDYSKNIQLEGKKNLYTDNLNKYPGNELIVGNEKKIIIFGY